MKQERALEMATTAHEGQIRKIKGEAYIEHPKRVAELVTKFKQSTNIDILLCASLLHDTVEDCDVSLNDIATEFGYKVASLVEELTSDTVQIENVSKKVYLLEKLIKMSSYGLVIKLCDRLDNCSDLAIAKKTFKNKYTEETWFILNGLEESGRKLTDTHKQIIKTIKSILEGNDK